MPTGFVSKFNVGDRVIAVRPVDGNYSTLNQTGTIVYIDQEDGYHIGIRFDNEVDGGHDLHGRVLPYGYGWWSESGSELELLSEQIEVPELLLGYESLVL